MRIPPTTRSAALALAALALFGVRTASAQTSLLPLDPGEVVATCQSGYGYDPTDVNGFTVVVMDTRDPAGNGALLDYNWNVAKFHNEFAPTTPGDVWNTVNLGEVFGVTLDGQTPPNIYVTASTVYGIYIDGAGTNIGVGPAGPGGIYRLDGVTGDITTCASLPNTGPALGNIAHDARHDQFYVSNFEDGLIYRIDASQCVVLDTWDHGLDGRPAEGLMPIDDDGSPGFTAFGRRVWGLEDHRGRLYYAVWNEDTGCDPAHPLHVVGRCPDPTTVDNEIWSVEIDSTTGGFVAGSAQLEVTLPPYNDGPVGLTDDLVSNPVSDIEFNASGNMLVAERVRLEDTGRGRNPNHPGSPWDAHRARVLEYVGASGSWAMEPLKKYRIGWHWPGLPTQTSNNSAGGVAPDADENVWISGDAIHTKWPVAQGRYIYGLQRVPNGGNEFAAPTSTATSYLVDLDNATTPGPGFRVHKTQVGEVDIYQLGSECMVVENVQADCPPQLETAFPITLDVTNLSGQTAEWVLLTPVGGGTVSTPVIDIPTLPDGSSTSLSFTLDGVSAGDTVCFLVTLATLDLEECCTEEVCVTLPDCDCFCVLDESIACDPVMPDCWTYTVNVEVKSETPVHHAFFVPTSGANAVDNYHTFDPPLMRGDVVQLQTKITGQLGGDQVCMLLSLHDELLAECCSEELKFVLPVCQYECMDWALSTRIVPCCPATMAGTITLTVCNTSTEPRMYDWDILGVPPDAECIAQLPDGAFFPSSGMVTVPPGDCVDVVITVDCSALDVGAPLPQVCAGYGIRVNKVGTMEFFSTEGTVYAADDTVVKEGPAGGVGGGILDVQIDFDHPLGYTIQNLTGQTQMITYSVIDAEPDADYDHFAISLDGLPPGEPIVRTVKVPPEGIDVQHGVRFRPETPAGTIENVFVSIDLDGDGYGDLMYSTILRAVQCIPAPRRIRDFREPRDEFPRPALPAGPAQSP